MKRRVVITGLGIVTSLGVSVDDYWEALLAGKSGISRIEKFDPSEHRTQVGGEIKNWNPTAVMDRKFAKRLDLSGQYAIHAAQQAVLDAGLLTDTKTPFAERDEDGFKVTAEGVDLDRCGSLVGTGIGGLVTLEDCHAKYLKSGPKKVTPFLIPMIMNNAAAGQCAIRFGFRGPCYSTASACASGTHCLGNAFRHIKWGDADLMLAGATEATMTGLANAGFCSARAMSERNDDPEHASRPFDKDRDGFVMSEGAGILIFEELEHARARGAKIYAEVTGYGTTDDAGHITAPDPEARGARRAMQLAIDESGIPMERYNYINAHGTSTPLNDPMETKAIKAVFGEDHAKHKLPISSTKSMIGHLLGASGAAELVATAKMIYHGIIHPTANLEHPDPECDLDYVAEGKREYQIDACVSNSFGFGGHNACIAAARCPEA